MKKISQFIVIIESSIEGQVNLAYKVLVNLNLDSNSQKQLVLTIKKLEKKVLIDGNIRQ